MRTVEETIEYLIKDGNLNPAEFGEWPKMKPESKASWLNALRSGDYKQGPYYLKSYDPDAKGYCHCCLGVQAELEGFENTTHKVDAEVAEIPSADAEFIEYGDHVVEFRFPDTGFECDAPDNFYWAKKYFAEEDISKGIDVMSFLIKLNDNGFTFEEIANLIEEKL